MESDELVNRFRIAFDSIEAHLRDEINESTETSFGRVLKQIESSRTRSAPIVRKKRGDLHLFSSIRNLIAHNRRSYGHVAYPADKLVEDIESLAGQLIRSPSIGKVVASKASCVSPTDSISDVIALMLKKDFDQVPVWDGKKLTTLLTTRMISRWVGRSFKKNGGLAEDEQVASIVAEDPTSCLFIVLRTDSTVLDVMSQFDIAALKGQRLEAILFNSAGTPKNVPDRIVTTSDIPILLQSTSH